MLTIGLTGGIASGKTTVSQFFRARNVPVIDADILGHRAYEPGSEGFKGVVATFGDDLVAPDGTIDRKVLGAKVFGKPEEMKRLTDVVWPAIRKMASEELSQLETAGNNLAVLEAAVLFEAGWEDLVDEIWVVVVDPDQAVVRLAARNGLDEAAARARLASQLSNDERISRGHHIINNSGSLEDLEAATLAQWEALQSRLTPASSQGGR